MSRNVSYAQCMKQSSRRKPPHQTDIPGNVRAEMGRAKVSALQLSRNYGGAPSYWTRRINGELPFDADDLEAVAEATGCHLAKLVGGEPPTGWRPSSDNGQYHAGDLAA